MFLKHIFVCWPSNSAKHMLSKQSLYQECTYDVLKCCLDRELMGFDSVYHISCNSCTCTDSDTQPSRLSRWSYWVLTLKFPDYVMPHPVCVCVCPARLMTVMTHRRCVNTQAYFWSRRGRFIKRTVLVFMIFLTNTDTLSA